MKKVILLSAIAISALMVGCSSTETRDDACASQAATCPDGAKCDQAKCDKASCDKANCAKKAQACADGAKACPSAAKACPDCKDGKMCDKCKAKMGG